MLERPKDAAYDIAGYRDAPPGLRIWCGATVDTPTSRRSVPWLDWAYAATKAELIIVPADSLGLIFITHLASPRP